MGGSSFTIMDKYTKMVTINVRGLGGEAKRREVFHYLHKKGFSIFLQDTHSEKKSEKLWSREFGSRIFFSHGDSQSRGVAILFSKEMYKQITVHNVNASDDG